MPKTTKVARPRPDRRKSSTTEPLTAAPAAAPTVPESEIARRAFEVYCARGGQHGRDLDDWLQAERELRSAASASN